MFSGGAALTWRADIPSRKEACKSFSSSCIALAPALRFLSLTRAEMRGLEVRMKKAIHIALVAAAAAAAILFSAPSAQAQVRVEGRFRLPHGDIAFGVGDPYVYYGAPAYPIGSYVPYGYRVIEDPRFGHGFYSPAFGCRVHHVRHRHWIPVRRYATRWVVIERPYFGGRYDRRGDTYRRYDGRRYDRRRSSGAYSGDPYYDFNREYWDRSYHPYDDPNYRPHR